MAVKIDTVSPADAGMRLHRWLKTHYDLSFVQVQKRCRKGEIRLNGKRANGKDILQTGMQVRIPPVQSVPSKPIHPKAYNAEDAAYIRNLVIYNDNDIIALNKPAGIAVQGGSDTVRHIDGLSRYLHRHKPRLVHRLDKDTSGVLLLAKNHRSAAELGRAFHSHKPRKIYWAIVVGEPKIAAGIITAPLIKNRSGNTEKMRVAEGGKRAVTAYEVLQRMGGVVSLIALSPRTGRTHQLRAHMAYLNTPILGDGKYGGKSAFVSDEAHMKKIHLHARSLSVNGITITADIPAHFAATCNVFGVDILPHYDTVFGDIHTCG